MAGDGRAHRLMLIRLSQEMTVSDAVRIGKIYALPGSVIDRIERMDSGMTLIQALEQRRKITDDDVMVMRDFCQTLYDLELDHLADKVKKAYPGLDAHPHVDPNPVNRDISDRVISELSACIGAEWKQVAMESLGLKKYNIEQIEEDNRTLRDKITAVFVYWRKKNPGNASAGDLKEILEGREDIDEDAIKVLE